LSNPFLQDGERPVGGRRHDAHMETFETLRVEQPADHVLQVVIARPEVANALNARFFTELSAVLDRIESDDDVRVWIVTGAPRPDGRPWFSAGVDLKEALAGAPRPTDPAALIERIDMMVKPSIAAIAGVCTTGALELAMACDLRVAASSARLSDWHLRRTGLGIGAWGAAARLSRLVGQDKAKELLLLGTELSGEEAARIGLVNITVPDDELMPRAVEWASGIAALPRRGVQATLGYLQVQESMSKHEAIRFGTVAPAYMGLRLRPFSDAAERFFRDKP
jgi:enoyl-CoA hydratase/carnithine racemase